MKPLPTIDRIEQAVRESGLLPHDFPIEVRPLPRNHERSDRDFRRQFHLQAGSTVLGFLTVGHSLRNLYDRTALYHQNYPNIGVRALGLAEVEGVDYFLQEYFDGRPAHKLLEQDNGPSRIADILHRIDAAYSANLRPSTATAARAELSELLNRVVALPYWTSFDLAFLREIAFPFLEEHLLPPEPCRRLTNGDLILRNVLSDEAGNCRVIDCEQAVDTHFHAEDWLRLGYWDTLPDEVRAFVEKRIGPRKPLALYFFLRQIILESQLSTPRKAHADVSHWCREIRSLMGQGEALVRESFFWPAAANSESHPPALEAQIFWLTDEGWADRRSKIAHVSPGRPIRLLFVLPADETIHGLRFDPMNVPGIAVIHSFTVVSLSPNERVLWTSDSPADLERLQSAADSITHVELNPDRFLVLSVGNDPQLYLPGVGSPAGVSLRVEIIVSYSLDDQPQVASLREQVNRLREAAETRDKTLIELGETLGRSLEAHQIETVAAVRNLGEQLRPEFDRCTGEVIGSGNKIDTLNSRLAQLQTELTQDRQRQGIFQNQLTQGMGQLTAIRETMCDQHTLARDIVNGHAQTIDRLELQLAASQRQLAELSEKLSASGEHIRQLEALAASSRNRIQAIERSFIWRATAWLRRLTG